MNVPGVVEVQENVAVPEPVTLLGVMALQVGPAGTVSVRTTVPEKPFSAATVSVDVALTPVLTAAGEVAEIEKSAALAKVNAAVVEWEREPLAPVIVTVKVFAVVEVQARVAVPAPEMLDGVIAPHVSPAGTVSVKLTVPAKPFTAATVIVEDADDPAVTDGGEEALSVKSTKLNLAVVE
jgi:hypothetical protein